jgi:hypothetical protein
VIVAENELHRAIAEAAQTVVQEHLAVGHDLKVALAPTPVRSNFTSSAFSETRSVLRPLVR